MRRSEDAFTTVAGDKSVGTEYASGMTATRRDVLPPKSDRVVGGSRGGRGGRNADRSAVERQTRRAGKRALHVPLPRNERLPAL